MASKGDDDELGCVLIIIGFVITGFALGWRWAFGFLGLAIIILGVSALSRK